MHILRPALRPTESNTLEAGPASCVLASGAGDLVWAHGAALGWANSIKYHICHLSETEAQSIHAKQTPILFQSLCSFYYTHLGDILSPTLDIKTALLGDAVSNTYFVFPINKNGFTNQINDARLVPSLFGEILLPKVAPQRVLAGAIRPGGPSLLTEHSWALLTRPRVPRHRLPVGST